MTLPTLASLAVIASTALCLGVLAIDWGLPEIHHSDFVQIEQAVGLLATGEVRDDTVYPVTLVFVYAAACFATFYLGRLLDHEACESLGHFVSAISRPEVHHVIGRAVGAGALVVLVAAAFSIARARFRAKTALLASALTGFSPAIVLYAHQVRPHALALTAVAVAGAAILRCSERGSLGSALRSGAAAGAVNAIFQVGMPLALGATLLGILRHRSPAGIARVVSGNALGFAGAWFALRTLVYRSPFVVPGVATDLGSQAKDGDLGFGLTGDAARWLEVPELCAVWAASEPIVAVGALAFAWSRLRGARGFGDLAIYSLIPAVVFATLGLVMGAELRYSMYATPFLAPLAAESILAAKNGAIRVVLVAIALLVPLATSLRIDSLLAKETTKDQLDALLVDEPIARWKRVVSAELALARRKESHGFVLFPRNGDYRSWLTGKSNPAATLEQERPDLFARPLGGGGAAVATGLAFHPPGLHLAARLGELPEFDPGQTRWLLASAWLASRPGPVIEIFLAPSAKKKLAAAPTILGATDGR